MCKHVSVLALNSFYILKGRTAFLGNVFIKQYPCLREIESEESSPLDLNGLNQYENNGDFRQPDRQYRKDGQSNR